MVGLGRGRCEQIVHLFFQRWSLSDPDTTDDYPGLAILLTSHHGWFRNTSFRIHPPLLINIQR